MDNLWKGIAIAGIWLGVGWSAMSMGIFAIFVAWAACEATRYIANHK